MPLRTGPAQKRKDKPLKHNWPLTGALQPVAALWVDGVLTALLSRDSTQWSGNLKHLRNGCAERVIVTETICRGPRSG
jgi:hypothetical protein